MMLFVSTRRMTRAVALWLVVLCTAASTVHAQPARDLVSDGVGATAGIFRVDESGGATYKISIAVSPGTGGVSPTLSLDYSSQGAAGVLGKGWSIGGQSSIGRCRKTREAGDFYELGSGPIDGAPAPVNLSQSDVFCLDGQRLLLISGTYGANGATYRPELDPWTRVTSLGGNNSSVASTYTGPLSFTVERKDGSLSEYGNSADARVERNQCGGVTGIACAISTWALNRVEDSTGNYLTYHYSKYLGGLVTTSGAGSDEFVLLEVRYTGKRVLSGQPGVASLPYARVLFDYSTAPTTYQQFGWQSGSRLAQTQQLNSVKVQDPFTGTPRTLRYYAMAYATSSSNSGQRTLTSVQECNKGPLDSGVDSAQVCYPATTFTESAAKYQFNVQATSDVTRNVSDRKGARYGDVDGDGRLDLVWIQKTSEITCKHRIYVSFGDRVVSAGNSQLTLATPAQTGFCVLRGDFEVEGAWQLVDYDGDGRDDLMLATASGSGSRWGIHRSTGRPASAGVPSFDTPDLLASINIPALDINASSTQLIDLNGDGLLDVLYPLVVDSSGSTYSQLYSRLRERVEVSPGTFELRFGLQSPVILNFPSSDPCADDYAGLPNATCLYSVTQYYNSSVVSAEFNGDGRGDLMLSVMRIYGVPRPADRPRASFASPEQIAQLRDNLPAGAVGAESYWYFFTSGGYSPLTSSRNMVQLATLRIYEGGVGEMPSDPRHIQMGDFNGDALTDLLYRVPSVSSGETWRLRLNNGIGFSGATYDATGVTNPDLVQVADINGDGRSDLLYPPVSNICVTGGVANSSRPFCVRYGQSGSATLASPVHVPGGGAHATTAPFDYDHHFADFDGDGATDYVRFKRVDGGEELFTSRSSTRHQAREVINQITDGLGAITQVGYQSLINASVYRRDSGALTAGAVAGRGSPLFDLLAPMYVVAKASSSAPLYTDAAAMAEVSYRYAGARMQSGGRGYLGFREIVSYDGVHTLSSARHIVSRTSYRQDFPFIGQAEKSEKFVVPTAVTHGTSSIDACRADPEVTTQNCFYTVGSTWPAQTGTKISDSLNVWACQGSTNGTVCPIINNPLREACIAVTPSAGEFSALGSQQPIFPYLTGSVEDAFAYNTTTSGNGAKLSSTVSAFCYEDTYGNLTYSKLERWDGADNPLSVQVSNNTYGNDATKWRLGRLSGTSVDTSRSCVAGATSGHPPVCSAWKTRSSGFAYDTSAAKTGLLTQEKVHPGGSADQELRTLYSLDAYGNRTHSFHCSAYEADGSTLDDNECKDVGRVPHRPAGTSGEITAVHRYSRATYDAIGRYLVSTRLPFFTASGTNNVSEQASMTIGGRDEFGNVIQQSEVNGRVATARYGALGRPYYAADNTGQSSTTTYRWCTSVSCPSDAVFRSQAVAAVSGGQSANPTAWTYYDRLGRPILVVTQAFAAGVTGKDFSAVCSYYDKKTRSERTSEPMFLTTAAASGAPNFVGGTYDPCVSALWNRSEFDVLGRPTKTVMPDNSETAVEYSGLVTVMTNAAAQKLRETKNALGEVVQVTQANPATPGLFGLSVDSTYDAQGNLVAVTRNADQGVIVNTYEYDDIGRRTATIDPDRGRERVYYNAAGEVIRTVDGAGMDVRMDIDALGRMWRRYSGSSAAGNEPIPNRIFGDGFEAVAMPSPGRVTDLWVYDTASNGRGLLHYEERVADGGASYRRTMSYDTLGRPSSRATLIEGSTTTEGWAYDGLGRSYLETDASGGTVERTYTARGYPLQLRNASTPSEIYQQISEHNARGQITQELRGAATVTRTFDPQRAWLTDLQSAAGTTLQNLTYRYDLLGNTTRRHDVRGNQREDFTYDGLNRLRTAVVTLGANPAATVLDLTYDKLGNICSKNGQPYIYAGRDGCNATGVDATQSPHAVTQIGTTTYRYGAQGQLDLASDSSAPSKDRMFAYDGLHQLSFVIVGSLFSPSAELELRYGPSGERYLRIEKTGAGTTSTRYLGSVERITRPSGVIETKRYIGGVLIQTSFSDTTPTNKRYVYPDALGSMDVLTNELGVLQERLSFDGHGTRRNISDWRYGISSYTPQNTNDGFTGHEHLDPFGLVHMNGRVYDPTMGRFIQADPMTDAGIQGMNRYSYVLNNPLSLTDPTGYFSWGRALRTVVAIVITVYTGGYAGTLYAAGNTVGALAVAAAGGFAAGAIQTGTLKGGLYGAFGAAAFFGVGTAFNQVNAGWAHNSANELTSAGLVAKTLAHGVTGGVMSDLQGGKFGHGFVSAGATQAISPQIDNIGKSGFSGYRVVAAAALGGTVSVATGGKFANGAVTAAFSRAFNDELEKINRQNIGVKKLKISPFSSADGYESAEDAALSQYKAYDSIYAATVGTETEVLGAIVNDEGVYRFSTVVVVPDVFEGSLIVEGYASSQVSGITHTHPGSGGFGGVDYEIPSAGLGFYVRTSTGRAFGWSSEGAQRYKANIAGMSRRSVSRTTLRENIQNPSRWGIYSICPGETACLPAHR